MKVLWNKFRFRYHLSATIIEELTKVHSYMNESLFYGNVRRYSASTRAVVGARGLWINKSAATPYP